MSCLSGISSARAPSGRPRGHTPTPPPDLVAAWCAAPQTTSLGTLYTMEDYTPVASNQGKPISIGKARLTLLVTKGSGAASSRAPVGNLAWHLRKHTKKYKKGASRARASATTKLQSEVVSTFGRIGVFAQRLWRRIACAGEVPRRLFLPARRHVLSATAALALAPVEGAEETTQ